ncbi:MAG: hypothetical protein VKI42_05615 [Synechococcaceae cyanobacterium]|nr:hypothetical protein [Synechococcaceae cyanobacterium]
MPTTLSRGSPRRGCRRPASASPPIRNATVPQRHGAPALPRLSSCGEALALLWQLEPARSSRACPGSSG